MIGCEGSDGVRMCCGEWGEIVLGNAYELVCIYICYRRSMAASDLAYLAHLSAGWQRLGMRNQKSGGRSSETQPPADRAGKRVVRVSCILNRLHPLGGQVTSLADCLQ